MTKGQAAELKKPEHVSCYTHMLRLCLIFFILHTFCNIVILSITLKNINGNLPELKVQASQC